MKKITIQTAFLVVAIIAVFILPGIFVMHYGLVELSDSKMKDDHYISIDGILTSYEENCNSDGSLNCLYSEKYTYTIDNIEYNIRSGIWHNLKPKIGQIIEIKYNPTNPKEAILANDS